MSSGIQFSHSVMWDALRPHGLQHARLPCPSPAPRIYSNSCHCWHQWCHPTISPSVVPFSYHLQSFPASGYFLISQFSCSAMSDSLQPHGLQHGRLPCPSPTPRAYSSSCPLNRWCHPTISSSAVPFSSRLQSFPASGYFPLSQFFASGGQSIGVSASASVLPMNIQEWFPLGLVGSPCSPWDSQESSPTPQLKSISSSTLSFTYSPALTSIHDYWKNHSFD